MGVAVFISARKGRVQADEFNRHPCKSSSRFFIVFCLLATFQPEIKLLASRTKKKIKNE